MIFDIKIMTFPYFYKWCNIFDWYQLIVGKISLHLSQLPFNKLESLRENIDDELPQLRSRSSSE